MSPSARGKLQTLISQQCEGWGALSWLSVSLEGSAPSLGPGEGGSFAGGGVLGASLLIKCPRRGEGVVCVCSPFLKRPSAAPALPSEDRGGKGGRRE